MPLERYFRRFHQGPFQARGGPASIELTCLTCDTSWSQVNTAESRLYSYRNGEPVQNRSGA